MSNVKKLLMAAAGSAGGAGLDVDEVFSIYVHDGTGAPKSIVNGIDLSGEGGLVISKTRSSSADWGVYDTERGVTKELHFNDTNPESTDTDTITAFNSNGFTVGDDVQVNGSTRDYCTWTFRKAPKFFDVVTYTGDGTLSRAISHNLGSVPGCIIFKRTNSTSDWPVYHRGNEFAPSEGLALNLISSTNSTYRSLNSVPTDSTFTVGAGANPVNVSGATYVAYVFAHNNSDGEFGPDSDQDIIKCGSYAGNGSSDGPEVDLGFEPQWLMFKRNDSTSSWFMYDVMRGIVTSGNDAYLLANEIDAENTGANFVDVTPTGFKITSSNSNINNSSGTYIYMAIRRGPLAEPTSATDVFSIDTSSGTSPTPPAYVANHLVDFAFFKDTNTTGNWQSSSRLTQGKTIQLNSSNAEADSSVYKFDFMNGWVNNSYSDSDRYAWMWKRAPSYFDVVAYTGNGTAGRTVSHNLGVAPEMIWVKQRNISQSWQVYHSGMDATAPEDYYMILDTTSSRTDNTLRWNDTAPTSSVFTVGSGSAVNGSPDTYIAYLFATLAGISKVGSFSHTNGGGDTNVDCGFSNGSKLVIVKNVDAPSNWYLWDSERGIVSGNESYLRINLSNSQISADFIDPLSSGFTMTSSFGNVGLNNYIFYAIAA